MNIYASQTIVIGPSDDKDDNGDIDGDIYRCSIALEETSGAHRRPGMPHSRSSASASDVGMGSNGSGGGSAGSAVPIRAGSILRRVLLFFVRVRGRGGHAGYRELGSLGGIGGGVDERSRAITPVSDDDDVGFDADAIALSCMDALQRMLFSSWLNALLVFVPIGMVTYLMRMKPIAVFASNAIAVIPLSSLLTAATERVASDAGDTVGALLNISLGNLVELILFIVALVNDQVRVVQASILGSILVNSLLILGTALLATGLTDNEPVYNTAETQLLSCLLFASVFVFLMPTAFGYTFDHTQQASKATLQMSRVSSLMVLFIYLVYFVHELRARPIAAKRPNTDVGDDSDDSEYDSERGLLIPLTPTTPTLSAPTLPDRPPLTVTSTAPAVPSLSSSSPSISSSAPECQQATLTSDIVKHVTEPQPRSVRFAEDQSTRIGPAPAALSNGEIEMSRIAHSHTHSYPNSHSHSRSVSVDSVRQIRRNRASSLSSSGVGMGGNSSSGVPTGQGGFSALGRPGLTRSGLTALHIMRDNQQAQAAQQAQRTSLESGASTSDHAILLGSDPLGHSASLALGGIDQGRPKRPRGEFMMAVIVLIVASALMSVNAEFLVDTIDDVTHQGHLSESVIGLIILPIVGNIAEYVTVVSVALRDKLDLAISVAIGSSIQIALCVTPLTVSAGWILNRNLSLTFSFFEMAALVGTALLVGLLVSSNGDSKLRTCGLKGALMCACYVIIGFGAYLSPNAVPK
ncbi:hypothetical protein SEPCBS119000_001850 [Sporothrix epigloea]|uniref:Sodium/calcium exchanger membrane region domain-containing protein n=1 Tax=Sporothrix epigloea TaxID=1892477 RepID=A0ABP0DCX9_9PEZI